MALRRSAFFIRFVALGALAHRLRGPAAPVHRRVRAASGRAAGCLVLALSCVLIPPSMLLSRSAAGAGSGRPGRPGPGCWPWASSRSLFVVDRAARRAAAGVVAGLGRRGRSAGMGPLGETSALLVPAALALLATSGGPLDAPPRPRDALSPAIPVRAGGRSAALRQCGVNNLKQLGLGLQSYNATWRWFLSTAGRPGQQLGERRTASRITGGRVCSCRLRLARWGRPKQRPSNFLVESVIGNCGVTGSGHGGRGQVAGQHLHLPVKPAEGDLSQLHELRCQHRSQFRWDATQGCRCRRSPRKFLQPPGFRGRIEQHRRDRGSSDRKLPILGSPRTHRVLPPKFPDGKSAPQRGSSQGKIVRPTPPRLCQQPGLHHRIEHPAPKTAWTETNSTRGGGILGLEPNPPGRRDLHAANAQHPLRRVLLQLHPSPQRTPNRRTQHELGQPKLALRGGQRAPRRRQRPIQSSTPSRTAPGSPSERGPAVKSSRPTPALTNPTPHPNSPYSDGNNRYRSGLHAETGDGSRRSTVRWRNPAGGDAGRRVGTGGLSLEGCCGSRLKERGRQLRAPPGFGKAKSVPSSSAPMAARPRWIRFDPKPDAPAEVRGTWKPIASSVPGVTLNEFLPRLAKLQHKTALLRAIRP